MKLIIEIPMITHCEKTDNKYAPNKMTKISGNLLYSQNLSRFQRAIVVKNIHKHFDKYLEPHQNMNINKVNLLTYKFHVVKNYGSISWRSGKICWKPVKADYEINWDLDNLQGPFRKCGNDSLVSNKVLIDDNASVINDTRETIFFVDDIKEMKIIIEIDYE